jgi:putative hemolysin
MCEAALLSVNKSRIEHLAAHKNRKAITVLKFIENPENFLSSVQVGITLIGIVSGVYGGTVLAGDLEEFFRGAGWNSEIVHEISIVIVVALITFFSIVIGELVPKSFAINHADRISLFCAPIMKFFTSLTYPMVRLLAGSTSFLTNLFGIKARKEERLSEEELKFMLKKAATQGILEKDESKLHQKLFSFSDQVAKSLMTHRTDLEWIDINSTKEETFEEIRNSSHSKFPVCDGTLDNLLGIVNVKDYLENYSRSDFDIQQFVKKPIMINEYTPAFKVLDEFRKKKEYAAIVVDEHGEIDGMITLHDMIEAIMGDMPEEDDTDPDIVKRSERSFLINGKTSIFDINDYFGIEIIEDDPHNYTTLSGYFLFKLGEIPKTGTKLSAEGISMEIVDMDGKRIDRILFEILDSEIFSGIN